MALVDAEGHVLALAAVPANGPDRDTLPALDAGKVRWPSRRLARLDDAFTAKHCRGAPRYPPSRRREAA
ncbi:hypothetical protein ASF53_22880 [Methylobacterium sp. Leaf123]|nr:hypothetical protein [Methylobacterium sp. Leaf123]KQQ25099.1 hypothetical protein ASF53_22880 [Methylobacterium sp. Leaf123]